MIENFKLRVFRVVADSLNFRRAAEELHLTQPAVTHSKVARRGPRHRALRSHRAGHQSDTGREDALAICSTD